MKQKLFFLLAGLSSFITVLSQDSTVHVTPFIRTGVGYFNEWLMIDGNVLSAEMGLGLGNGYSFSLLYSFAETVNDRGNFENFGLDKGEFIYTYKLYNMMVGYEFTGRKQRHSFVPRLGLFYAVGKIATPVYDEEYNLSVQYLTEPYIGAVMELGYMYNFKRGISVGLSTGCYLAYQYGFMYFTITPVVAFNIR
jgi:hypothetical protein